MYELTAACNQDCAFCYNSWRGPGERVSELNPAQARRLVTSVLDQVDCASVALSGGEPTLRPDLYDLVSLIAGRGCKVLLITNGTLLTPAVIDRCLDAGVSAFQVSLLGHRPELHNRLTGFDGFEKVIDAILHLSRRNATVHTYFAGLAQNMDWFRQTLELNVMLGVHHVALGRVTPGGAGLDRWREQMPSPHQVEQALAAAHELCGRFHLAVSVSTPILPCLNNIASYNRVRFAFCGAQRSGSTLYGIDPEGFLKPCSHSPHRLGNLLEKPFAELTAAPYLRQLATSLPEFCRDCADVGTCRGGCRSAACLASGALDGEDPYLALHRNQARKPTRRSFDSAEVAHLEVC
jgi:radical SAM protein with 4Fe4S-binding SPASM domain